MRPAMRGRGPARLLSPLPLLLAASVLAFLYPLATGQSFFDGDLTTFAVWRSFLRDHLAQGVFPLWNPYYLGGSPFLGHPDTMAAYPLLYPILLFPIPLGVLIFGMLHLFLGAWGARSWLRALHCGEAGSLLGGLCYGLSGFFWSEIIHPPVQAAYAWFPWVLWGIERMSAERTLGRSFQAGLCFAMLFLSGSYQMTLGASYAGAFYGACRLWQDRRRKGRDLTFPLLGFVWGALPLLALLIPSYEFLRSSDRAQGPLDFSRFNAAYALDPGTLSQFLFPSSPFHPRLSPEAFLGNAGHLGWFAPLLILWSCRKERHPLSIPLACGALFFFLLSLGKAFPIFHWMCLGAPGFGLVRGSFRFLFVALAFGSLFIARGFDWLEDPGNSRKALGEGILYGGLFLVLGYFQNAPLLLTAPLLGTGAMVLTAAGRWPKPRLPLALGLSLFLSLLLGGWHSCPSRLGPSSNFDFPPPPSRGDGAAPSRLMLEDGSLDYPVLTSGKTVRIPYPVDATCLFAVRNALGYSPVVYGPTVRLMASTPVETWAKLFAVKDYVLKDKGKPGPAPPLMGSFAGRLPFLYAPSSWERVANGEEALQRMAQGPFDPLALSYLQAQDPSQTLPGGPPLSLPFRFIEESPDKELFELSLDRPRGLIFSEVDYPGWKTRLDGKGTGTWTANGLFRALEVPAGRHRIEFSYEPAWKGGLAALLLAWLAVTGAFWKKIMRGNDSP